MKKKIKLIFSIVIALCIIVIYIINNFGMRIKYEIPTRKVAKTYYYLHTIENRDIHYSKMKYLFTTYNEKSNIYRVNYYALIDGKEDEWMVVEADLGGSDMQIVNMDAYDRVSNEISIKDYRINFKSIEDSDGNWVKLDKPLIQNSINFLLIIILLIIMGLFIVSKKNTIQNILIKASNKTKSINLKDNTPPSLNSESDNNNLKRMKELAIMKEGGFITEEEFQNKKKDILDKM